ncbi:hypothetical protein [Actinokineospora pegani]|uniref:hypothetical protein n=1 Tax=Actinokineospora pegani TaxID=2654637 RepID=UPI0012EA5512|nr:hypothetical protein [Actinokineospora pegani]
MTRDEMLTEIIEEAVRQPAAVAAMTAAGMPQDELWAELDARRAELAAEAARDVRRAAASRAAVERRPPAGVMGLIGAALLVPLLVVVGVQWNDIDPGARLWVLGVSVLLAAAGGALVLGAFQKTVDRNHLGGGTDDELWERVLRHDHVPAAVDEAVDSYRAMQP